MKFRKFVGEEVREKLKKIVDTPIGKTEKDFYNVVARRDESYITETSVGFGLSKMQLKKVFDYIKSWLIRYDIKYEAINPYLTVAKVDGSYKRDRFIKSLKKAKENQIFKPVGVYILREDDIDFIILDYLYSRDFVKKIDESILNLKLAKKEETCYVKLFSLKAESFPLQLFDEMVYSLPILPNITAGSVGLLVRRK